MSKSGTDLLVRDTIARDLGKEIPGNGVVKVAEQSMLAVDLNEYVLTSQLAEDFHRILERVVQSARVDAPTTDRVGVWVSGFFGSGKSHFAKLVGHLIADTPTGDGSARELFRKHLRDDRQTDQKVAGALQEATTHGIKADLVAFDITALQAQPNENVGLIILRAFYRSLGLSSVISFATRELELMEKGRYDEFLRLYEETNGISWATDKDQELSDTQFAACLAMLLPERYSSADNALASLTHAIDAIQGYTIQDVTSQLKAWADKRSKEDGRPRLVVFVADEVGAWAGRRLQRIEQVRTLVEGFSSQGGGRLWLIATSQERLSEVILNSDEVASQKEADHLLERLTARFPLNVHIESSEVGAVIEDRILRKRPTARPDLAALHESARANIADIGESPGIELGGRYPQADLDAFVRDYPFLPYQLPAAADLFGVMRGVKISSGARSMLKVALDAAASVGGRPLGAIVPWDGIFDSANRGNEFADEQYLGSQGLEYIAQADRDLAGIAPLDRPSRLLKVLWLVQRSQRIPRTVANVARLLAERLDQDILGLERDVQATLEALAKLSYVRKDPATSAWRFLTPDEVTVEKIVSRIARDDIRETDIRRERQDLVATHLRRVATGRINMGKTQTVFQYGVFLNEAALVNEDAVVQLRVHFADAGKAKQVAEGYAAYLKTPEVHWVVTLPQQLDERLRRVLATRRLPTDDEFQRIATQRTKDEARKLEDEASRLLADAGRDVERALQGGVLYWGGSQEAVTGDARPRVDAALRDRLTVVFTRFNDGDRPFTPAHVDRLFAVPPADRAALDPGLGLFDVEGHVHGNHPVAEELSHYLKSGLATNGQAVVANFRSDPFGWPIDLVRYAAAALFVDGRLRAVDQTGKSYDNPKDSAARAQFGTGPFRNLRLEVEEEPPTPVEISAGRALLSDLGFPTGDAGEVTLGDALARALRDITTRLAVADRAQQAAFPLPTVYDETRVVVDEIAEAGSRAKRLRALLARTQEVRDGHAATKRLQTFVDAKGLEQCTRSRGLMSAALAAGLDADETWGLQVAEASEQLGALVEQRRVLDEWDGAYREHRETLIKAFRAVYEPLRAKARTLTEDARNSLLDSAEFEELEQERRLRIRMEFLASGRPLSEVPEVALKSDEDLLAANGTFSISHLRARLTSIDGVLSTARQRVLAELAAQQPSPKVAGWNPKEDFGGRVFTKTEEVDEAFDQAREKVKAMVRSGKAVRVV